MNRPALGSLSLALLLLFGSAPAAFAQADANAPATEEAAPEEPAFDCTGRLALPLVGLTEDNLVDVERALRNMERPRYKCPTCSMKASWRATCEGCGETFEQLDHGEPLFRELNLDLDTQTMCVQIDHAGSLSLMGLSQVLRPTGARLDRAELAIVEWTRITVRMDPKQVTQAKRALMRPGLFASVGVRVDKDSPSTSFIIQHPPRRPVTLTRVAEALGKASPGLVFEDITWPAPCKTCVEDKERSRAGCRACWQAEHRREKARNTLR